MTKPRNRPSPVAVPVTVAVAVGVAVAVSAVAVAIAVTVTAVTAIRVVAIRGIAVVAVRGVAVVAIPTIAAVTISVLGGGLGGGEACCAERGGGGDRDEGFLEGVHDHLLPLRCRTGWRDMTGCGGGGKRMREELAHLGVSSPKLGCFWAALFLSRTRHGNLYTRVRLFYETQRNKKVSMKDWWPRILSARAFE